MLLYANLNKMMDVKIIIEVGMGLVELVWWEDHLCPEQ